jgi:phosphoribosyl 1,2-cyclic phosphodiesterase
MFFVRFWGVRGSIPCPGRETVIYGGNTSCLEIRAGEKLVIVDLGSGIRPLGDRLLSGDYIKGPVDADIFISHTHWDHIMGFPMFAPIFSASTKLHILGPVSSDERTLESIIGDQLSYRYWPVRHSELAAKITYEQIRETTLDLGGGLEVSVKYLNHPILCLGYRFEYRRKSIVTAFDHEPFRNLFPVDPNDPAYDEGAAREGERAAREENKKIFHFIENADVLISDGQYTAAEFEKHRGWGHSSCEDVLAIAEKAKVKTLVFFHHDPGHSDDQLAVMEKNYQEQAAISGFTALMAREGLTLEP